ncbi:MAG: butyrate kinase [Chitinophagales bacterium]
MTAPAQGAPGHRILAINPGSTSTKFGVFRDGAPLHAETIRHSREELGRFPDIPSQRGYRAGLIASALPARGLSLSEVSAVVGRGGLLRPVAGGVYLVDDALCRDLVPGAQGEHAANLGALLARDLAEEASAQAGRPVPAFVVDPVATDEFAPLARYSGLPELPRRSLCHALNMKAVGRRFARSIGRRYDELDLVIVHLGGGCSVAAHRHGRIVDSTNGYEDGPFTPERAGALPASSLVDLAFSGRYPTKEALLRRIQREGGLYAYLGTNDAQEVEERIEAGDPAAHEVYQALAYQTAKEIGGMAAVLGCQLDAILLTGGLAHSSLLTGWIEERVGRLAPVFVFPGEDELLALAEGAARVLCGEEEPKRYGEEGGRP